MFEKVTYIVCIRLSIRAGYSQSLQIGINGFEKVGIYRSFENTGSVFIKHKEAPRFSYGLSAAYQYGRNGLEIDLNSFPYRVDLLYKDLIGTYDGSTNLFMISALYKYKFLFLNKKKVSFFLMGGFGVSKYKYQLIRGGGERITDNTGNIIFLSTLERNTDYNKPIVFLPTIKFEVEKLILRNFIISISSSYSLNNLLSNNVPLEYGIYSIKYNNKNSNGKIEYFGKNYQIGINLKYKIKLN